MSNRIFLRSFIFILTIVSFISCKKSGEDEPAPKPQVMFRKVVILGNSITLTPINTYIGWNVARGMAASVPDSDYVHRLTARLKLLEPTAQVTVKFFDDFEGNYHTYDFNSLKEVRDSDPDLVIVRVGENVNRAKLDGGIFDSRYQEAISYLTANNKNLVILSVGPLWLVPEIDAAMKKYTPYVSLSPVSYDATNFAYGLFDDPGVAQHPGDKGMRVICDTIWNNIIKINPYKNN